MHHMHSVFRSRGLDEGFAYVKAVRGNYLNALSGNPERFPRVALTKEGLPLSFGPLLKHFRVTEASHLERWPALAKPARFVVTSRTEVLQMINTVLFSTRALKGQPRPDLSTVIAPSKRGSAFPEIGRYAEDF